MRGIFPACAVSNEIGRHPFAASDCIGKGPNMPDQTLPTAPTLAAHGATQLASVSIDAYNAELRSAEGFVGDRASNRAFRAIIEDWRDRLRQVGADPFGDTPSENLSKKKLDKLLTEGDPEAAG